jgi:two-component system, chemotaxis family, CheB/CheR fusion protein
MVVGIGASAGGITALKEFFGAVPADSGITFVVVIHLAPEHESILAEVLQGSSPIPVRQVTARVEMEPDHAYVIPPNKNLVIEDGHLGLRDFDEPRGHRAPIDVFFRTLADRHPDGVGIILSGSGTDGTVGMKAIKEGGGILMAQAPAEAEFPEMPRSAIATGLVDFVAPVRDLPARLLTLRGNGMAFKGADELEEVAQDEAAVLSAILAQLRSRTGHDFDGYKRSTLLRRLGRRMRVSQTESLTGYLGYLRGSATEAEALFKDLLISVTNFFRDTEAFEALEDRAIPELFAGKAEDGEVRVWVPGCATGEEAYSVAMLLCEQNTALGGGHTVQVFASDLDEEALDRAREGLYPEAIAADVSEERLRQFFTKEGAYYRVKRELRDAVLFTTHSLLKDPPFSRLDLITCRNLLIYLRRDLQEKVFELFHYALRPGGFLLLGTSESAEEASDLFETVSKEHRLYRRPERSAGTERLPHLPLSVTARGRTRISRIPTASVRPPTTSADLHRAALEAVAPPSLLVNAEYEIVHISETASRYLQYPAGTPTASALKVIRPELRVDLRPALFQALDKGKGTVTRPVVLTLDGELRQVQVVVRPSSTRGAPPSALVVFVEAEASGPMGEPPRESATDGDLHRRMEEQVEDLRGRLQDTVEEADTQHEELKAANEELQSINEEYRSTLEELETGKEELQSINEELRTVNDELKGKVDALSRANNDLSNLMAATDVATLFLDRDLRIQRYTPSLARLFNVMPVDRGRPLDHVTHRLDYPALKADVLQVLDRLIPIEREVVDEDGGTHLARLLPYRTTDDHIEGVVLTLTDVSRIKAAQEELRRSEERYDIVIENVREYGIFATDEQGTIVSWNPGAAHIFGYAEEEAVGQPIALIFTPEDRAEGRHEDEMRFALADGHAQDERWHIRKDGGRFWGSGILTALYDEAGRHRGFAKVLRDNTAQRQAADALERSRRELQALNETLEQRVETRTAELHRMSHRARRLASEVVLAEQQERHRIAQLLHDGVQQLLFATRMKVSLLEGQLSPGSPRDAVAEATAYIEDAIEQTRQLAISLSPPILRGEGLADALGWLAAEVQRLHALEVEVRAESPAVPLDDGMRVLLFQIARELLFNVVKHADIKEALIEVEHRPDRVTLRVSDRGRGFEVAEAVERRRSSMGLRSVRERVDVFGGTVEVTSTPGEGTTVHVSVPRSPEAEP